MRALMGFGLWLFAGIATANTYTVTKNVDSNDGSCNTDCSLREAIAAANANPGADVVRLKHPFYRLTVEVSGPRDSQLSITDDLVIRGLLQRSTIDANATNRHFDIADAINVELADLTLRNGVGEDRGGSIRNAGKLTLRRTSVIGNRVLPGIDGTVLGGGIWNRGELRVLLGKVDRNIARDDQTLTGGRGGGIYNDSGAQLYVYDTLIRSNETGLDDATGFGAGLYNRGQARIDRSYFGDNDPGDGEGSAIANRDGGSLSVFNSTLSDNGHDGARGAIANGSTRESDPTAGSSAPTAFVANSTIANNNGGGYLNTGKTRLSNAIVAGNYSQDGNDRYYDTGSNCDNRGDDTDFTQTYSAMGSGNCSGMIYIDDSRVFADWLEHLRYLGGPTPMHKPRQPLVDRGDPAYCSSVDQRRVERPMDGDDDGTALCDIGAMELLADE